MGQVLASEPAPIIGSVFLGRAKVGSGVRVKKGAGPES